MRFLEEFEPKSFLFENVPGLLSLGDGKVLDRSFPDIYQFLGPRVSQYEQVGNAVPVLMAKAIAAQFRAHLEVHGAIPVTLSEAAHGQ